MKQVNIPTEYLSNSERDLKRAALVNKDLDLLRAITDYDEFTEDYDFFYVRENESVIRDRTGNVVTSDMLPYPQEEASLHLMTITCGQIMAMMPDEPGDLVQEIQFVNKSGNRWRGMILEVLPDTEFPLPESFDWFAMCAANPRRKYPGGHQRRLNGYSWHTKATI